MPVRQRASNLSFSLLQMRSTKGFNFAPRGPLTMHLPFPPMTHERTCARCWAGAPEFRNFRMS
eukprot:2074059-Pyramimonas_sp.AAC.1